MAWQQTSDGHKGRRPPAPIQRPGVESNTKSSKFRSGDAMTIEEFERRYAEKLKRGGDRQ